MILGNDLGGGGYMYQKRISYVYEYVNGVKGKNVGFVKLKIEKGLYKLQLQIKYQGMTDQPLVIAGYWQNQDRIVTEHFGKMTANKGLNNCWFSGKITPQKAEDMKGVLIFLEGASSPLAKRFFTAEWTEESVQWENVTLEESREENSQDDVLIKEGKEGNLSDDVTQKQTEEEKLREYETKDGEITDNYGVLKRTSGKCDNTEKNRLHAAWLKNDEEDASSCEGWGQSKIPNCNCEEENGKKEEAQNVEDESWDSFKQRREALRAKWQQIQQEQQRLPELWATGEEVLERFPVMNPFFRKDIVASVRIEPKDIGKLPMEFWYLANNSFLLHGYYYYRHLLFLKMERNKEYQYCIAIPGLADKKQEFMANLFGFQQFIPINNKTTENFGYWWQKLI